MSIKLLLIDIKLINLLFSEEGTKQILNNNIKIEEFNIENMENDENFKIDNKKTFQNFDAEKKKISYMGKGNFLIL